MFEPIEQTDRDYSEGMAEGAEHRESNSGNIQSFAVSAANAERGLIVFDLAVAVS
jgi:hypothetical protein